MNAGITKKVGDGETAAGKIAADNPHLTCIPVTELGATGSYKRMAGVFFVLAVMAWFGWMERDNTIVGAGDTAHKRPNVKLSGAPLLARPLERWVGLRHVVSLAVE